MKKAVLKLLQNINLKNIGHISVKGSLVTYMSLKLDEKVISISLSSNELNVNNCIVELSEKEYYEFKLLIEDIYTNYEKYLTEVIISYIKNPYYLKTDKTVNLEDLELEEF